MSLCLCDTAPGFKRRVSSMGEILLEKNRLGYCHYKQLHVTKRMTRIHQPWNTTTGESRKRPSFNGHLGGCSWLVEDGSDYYVAHVSVVSVSRHKICSDHLFRVHEQQVPMVPHLLLLQSLLFRRWLPVVGALVLSPFQDHEPTLKKGAAGYWMDDLSNISCCKVMTLFTQSNVRGSLVNVVTWAIGSPDTPSMIYLFQCCPISSAYGG